MEEPKDFIDEVNKNNAEKESVKKDQKSQQSLENAKAQVIDAMVQSTKANMKHRESTTTKVDVQNDVAETGDINRAIQAINNLAVLSLSKPQETPSVNIDLGQQFNTLSNTLTDILKELRTDKDDEQSQALNAKLDAFLAQLKALQVKSDPDLKKSLTNVEKALTKLDMKPQVNVAAPKVTVQGKELDLSPLSSLLADIKTTLSENKPPELDLEPVLSGLGAVQDAITGLRFPVANYVLPFKDSNGKDTQVQLDASGNVPVTGGGSGGGGTQYAELTTTAPATGTVALGRYKSSAPTLTDGQLYAPQLDANGNLKVAIASGGGSGGTASSFGAAFPATGTALGLSDGTNMQGGHAFDLDSGAGTEYNEGVILRKAASGGSVAFGTSADPIRTDPTGSTTQPISAAALPLPSAASTSTKQSDGSQKTQIVDGSGNVIGSTTNALDINIKSGNPTSITANAGTNLNTSLLALESGGNLANISGATGATAAAIPARAFMLGLSDGTNLVAATQAKNALNTTAGGLQAVGLAAQFDDVSPTAITENNFGNIRISANRNLYGSIRDAAGNERGANVSAGNALLVDASATTQPVSGTVTANQGTSPWVTSNATTSVVGNGAAATAQRVTLANDSTGIIATVGAVTAITNALPAGTNAIGKLAANSGVIIGDVNVVSNIPGVAATSLGKAEDAAHTTGDTGVMALGVRNDTLAATTNTTADYTQLSTDQAGIVIAAGAPRALKANQVTTITSSTSETTIVTAVASTTLDMYGLIITNTSATAVNVAIKDGTAGTTRLNLAVPAGDTRGFMLPQESAIKQSATNANWTATSSASVASLVVTALTTARV